MRKRFCLILALLFACGIAVGVWQSYIQLQEYGKGIDTYMELGVYIQLPDENESEKAGKVPEVGQSANETGMGRWPIVDFTSLAEINPDIVGWLYQDGTNINYPVVWNGNNEYYLKHLFDGTYNSAGCLFLDCRNTMDFTDRNNIIYGHHMKNGSMFSSLTKYKDQAYYEEHPAVLLMVPGANYEIKLFAGYVAGIEEDAWKIGFLSDIEFNEWLEGVRAKSCFVSEITPAAADRVITLSTCSYEFKNARFVLHGVLTEQ